MPDTPTSQDVFSKNQRKYRQQLRKRAIISLEQKKAICRYHVAHPKARHFEINDALEIDVERTTILKIVKEKDKWLDLDSRGSAGKKAVRRPAKFSKVNRAVALWLQICHPRYLRHLFTWGPGTSLHNTGPFTGDKGEQDSMEMPSAKEIQALARSFAAKFPDETAFKASTGWLGSFRQNLSLAQFPAIASTLELISETDPPFYRFTEKGTGPCPKPDPVKLSRFIYNQVMSCESGQQNCAMDPDDFHTLFRTNNTASDASRQSQTLGLDLSTATPSLAMRNDFTSNPVRMNNPMYLSSPVSHDLAFSNGSSFGMQNFETPRPRPSVSLAGPRSGTTTPHLDRPIQSSVRSLPLTPSLSSSASSPGSPVAMSIEIDIVGLPHEQSTHLAQLPQAQQQPGPPTSITSLSSSSFHLTPDRHQQPQVPSREQVFHAMTTLMAWTSHADAVSVVGSDNSFYLALSQARMRLLQQQQQGQH